MKRFRSETGCRKSDNKTFRLVLAACGTTYEPCPPYIYHKNGVTECMIQTITEKAPSIMIDSQALLSFCRKAANTAVYLNQRTPKEGLTRRDSRNGYHAPYPTPYEMLQALGKPSHNNDGNEISYKAPLHHLQRFGCYASRLIPEPQLVLATGLGNQPAVQFSPAVCFSSVHYPAKNPTQVDLAGVLPRPD